MGFFFFFNFVQRFSKEDLRNTKKIPGIIDFSLNKKASVDFNYNKNICLHCINLVIFQIVTINAPPYGQLKKIDILTGSDLMWTGRTMILNQTYGLVCMNSAATHFIVGRRVGILIGVLFVATSLVTLSSVYFLHSCDPKLSLWQTHVFTWVYLFQVVIFLNYIFFLLKYLCILLKNQNVCLSKSKNQDSEIKEPTAWKKIFTNQTSKGPVSRIYKNQNKQKNPSYDSIRRRQVSHLKVGKEPEQLFLQWR